MQEPPGRRGLPSVHLIQTRGTARGVSGPRVRGLVGVSEEGREKEKRTVVETIVRVESGCWWWKSEVKNKKIN